MLRLFDFQCLNCQIIHEELVSCTTETAECPKCGSPSVKVIGIPTVHPSNEDAPWIRSVLEVVDKDSTAPHVREFLASPTRTNYRKWLKKEGLRPLEPGEKPILKKEIDEKRLVEKTWESFKKETALDISLRRKEESKNAPT